MLYVNNCLQSCLTNIRVCLFATFIFVFFIEKQELWPALQIAVATLSMGPVGPGDMIGATNKDLLMRYQYITSIYQEFTKTSIFLHYKCCV